MSTTITSYKNIEEVEKLFKTWRRTRKHHKPIPAELWEAATSLTANYSVPTIAKRLVLNPAELKKRAPTVCTYPSDSQQPGPAFIELEIGTHGIDYEGIIEMEDQSGSKMKMYIKDTRSLDMYALCRAFWSKQI